MTGKGKTFTLTELIVVIAIISILTAILAPNAFQSIEKAKVAKVERDLKSFETAAVSYYTDTGGWPPDSTNWFSSDEEAFFITGLNQPSSWKGPYLEKWPDPPWHCQFTYNGSDMKGSYDWDYWVDWSYWGSVPAGTETCGASVSCVPQSAALVADQHLDDGTISSGDVRWSGSYAGGFMTVIILHGGEVQ